MRNGGLTPWSEPSLTVLMKSPYPDIGVLWIKAFTLADPERGDIVVGKRCAFVIGGLCSKKDGSSVAFSSGGVGFCSAGVSACCEPCDCGMGVGVVFVAVDEAGAACCGGGEPSEAFGEGWDPVSVALPLAPSAAPGGRLLIVLLRRCGRSVHRRLRPAHRLQGNFLSHLVLVRAQLLQAIGVRPAGLIMVLVMGIPSWPFWSLPCTV